MDSIEKHFMERIDAHLSVLEYQMKPDTYIDEEPPYNVPSIISCRDSLKNAKYFMKILNKYQNMKARAK